MPVLSGEEDGERAQRCLAAEETGVPLGTRASPPFPAVKPPLYNLAKASGSLWAALSPHPAP